MKIRDEVIMSRQNRTVVETGKLTDRKCREQSGLFRFDGIKLLSEAVNAGIVPELILIRESSLGEIRERTGCDKLDCEAVLLSDDVFLKLSEEKSPEGVICVAKHLDNFRKIATINRSGSDFGGRILLAESIRDPGNLGTVMRSAAALGCDELVVSADCADLYNPKTIRAAMGAAFRLRVASVDSLPEAVSALRNGGRRVFAAALDAGALALGSFDTLDGDCFVVGNEGHGLSRELLDACTDRVYIPMRAGSESLNAAAAAAILLWEQERCFRQRNT